MTRATWMQPNLAHFRPDGRVDPTVGYRFLGVECEHRVVLRAVIGPDPHPCHWCNRMLTWGVDLHVDHVDHDRLNNDPHNLVPSCQACNNRRAHAFNKVRAYCPEGHLMYGNSYTPANNWGWRACLTCRRGGYASVPVQRQPSRIERAQLLRQARIQRFYEYGASWTAVSRLAADWGVLEECAAMYIRESGIRLPNRNYADPTTADLSPLERTLAGCVRDGTCLIWQGLLSEGSPAATIKGKNIRLRRLVYEARVGPLAPRRRVLLRCGRPACLEATHFYLGTPDPRGPRTRPRRVG